MTLRTWLDAVALGVVITLAALVWFAMLTPLPGQIAVCAHGTPTGERPR